MFQTLSNVQSGEALHLQQCIDNRGGNLRIGLRSLTYTVAWNNIEDGESISWRAVEEGSHISIRSITPGLYSLTNFRGIVRRLGVNISLNVNRHNGLISLILPRGWLVKFTDGLLNLMGLDDGLNGQWLEAGTYMGDCLVDFTGTKTMHIHLDQINTSENGLNGAPTTLLCLIPAGSSGTSIFVPSRFGDINTVRFEHPEFKRLQVGMFSELKFTVKDDRGRVLDNHGQPISVVVEIQ